MSGKTATADPVVAHREDHDLVAAVRHGDDRAFEQLYEQYFARIAAYVRGMVKDRGRAEDITQEVFFSALRRMRETERPIAFKPWIYEIARNACIDHFRRTSRAEELSYDADGGLPSADQVRLVHGGPGPDAAVDSKQRLDDLCGAFGGLSETHHQILVLRELEGLSYRQIGERLGMSRPAVESTLFRARRRLTEEYEELVSGRRCRRVQSIIGAAAEGMVGARDRQRLARHISHCQACRRHARRMGVDDVRPQRSVRAKLAALLPLPAFLRRGGHGGGMSTAAGGHGSNLAHLSSTLGAAAEPAAASWSKAVATVAALAVAGAGAVGGHRMGLPVPGVSDLPLVHTLSSGKARGDHPSSRTQGATGSPRKVRHDRGVQRGSGAAASIQSSSARGGAQSGGPHRGAGAAHAGLLPGPGAPEQSRAEQSVSVPNLPVPGMPGGSGGSESGGSSTGEGQQGSDVGQTVTNLTASVRTGVPQAQVPASAPEVPKVLAAAHTS